jgi:very-short-patch-repair endonuclease
VARMSLLGTGKKITEFAVLRKLQLTKMCNFLKTATNTELINFYKKTDYLALHHQFKDNFNQIVKHHANPEYGETSKFLSYDMKGIKKEDFIIFTINGDDIKYQKEFINNSLFPFNNVYVQTSIFFEDFQNNRLIQIPGILITKRNNIITAYAESVNIREQTTFMISSIKFDESDLNKRANPAWNDLQKVLRLVAEFITCKLNTKEYTDYYKFENGSLIKKQIVYASDVKAHRRHFWKDTGYYIIPNMSNEQILEKGYGIDSLVFKNGELRENVPYTIIGASLKNKELKRNNRIIDLIKKRVWRSQEKLGDILMEIFPDNIIRKNDRKTLNGLELDFNLPELRLGVEYDGEQHFDRKVCEEVFKSDFDAQVRRDREKNKRCRKKNIKLLRIKYDEPLNKTHVKKKLKSMGIQTK